MNWYQLYLVVVYMFVWSAMEVDEPSKAAADAAATETVKPVVLVRLRQINLLTSTSCVCGVQMW